jgi:hypothetical protein
LPTRECPAQHQAFGRMDRDRYVEGGIGDGDAAEDRNFYKVEK